MVDNMDNIFIASFSSSSDFPTTSEYISKY